MNFAPAAAFAAERADARYERSDTQSFYNEFSEVFGVRRRQVATVEQPVKKLGDRQGFIDLFWKGALLVEQNFVGRNLVRANAQAVDYFPSLKPCELPRFALVSDFQTFKLHDLESDEPPRAFALSNFPRHVERFEFIVGVERRTFRNQEPANTGLRDGQAARRLGGERRSCHFVGPSVLTLGRHPGIAQPQRFRPPRVAGVSSADVGGVSTIRRSALVP